MNSRRGAAILALAGIAAAVALFLVLKDDEDEEAPAVTEPSTVKQAADDGGGDEGGGKPPDRKPEITKIVVRDGEPVGGVAEIEVRKGGTIAFEVESDVAEEVHLHGYDVIKEVTAGGSVSFEVPAKNEGVFEAELEGSHTQIAEVSVVP